MALKNFTKPGPLGNAALQEAMIYNFPKIIRKEAISCRVAIQFFPIFAWQLLLAGEM